MDQLLKTLLAKNIQILSAATNVLEKSHLRVSKIFTLNPSELSFEQKESCEAFTARFSRFYDFIILHVFRTIDKIEMQDEGTIIDRLNRMEKSGIISSTQTWRELRELRNNIAHEYLIEKSDAVLLEAHKQVPVLLKTVSNINGYIAVKKYL